MNAVLLSVRPKWCKLIANGKKTIDVRKSAPKIETPFKVYIYMTKVLTSSLVTIGDKPSMCHAGMLVIGEFVCDCITPLYNVCNDEWKRLQGTMHEIEKQLVKNACMTEAELHNYANGKQCFAWHISDLKIYDKPKTLNDFYMPCGKVNCKHCAYFYKHDTADSYDTWCAVDEKIPIVRPPQSYMYVEER